MTDNVCYVPVSIGELIDKYTILQIKQERIENENNIWGLGSKIRYLISLKIIHAVARHL